MSVKPVSETLEQMAARVAHLQKQEALHAAMEYTGASRVFMYLWAMKAGKFKAYELAKLLQVSDYTVRKVARGVATYEYPYWYFDINHSNTGVYIS